MQKSQKTQAGSGQGKLIRLGGLAIVAGLAIHIILNVVIKEFPPENPTSEELKAYLSKEAGAWAIVHGFRYIAFTCIVLFSAGVFARTCRHQAGASLRWGMLGVFGTAVWVTNGMITNGIEMLAFINNEPLSQRQELFWLLFHITPVLFTAEIVARSILILGFSMAGWCSASLPKWLGVLGFVQVTAGLLSGILISSTVSDGKAIWILDVAAYTGLAWFACVGFYLLLKGDGGHPHSEARSDDIHTTAGV